MSNTNSKNARASGLTFFLKLSSFLAATLFIASASVALASDLIVVVENIKNDQGNIRVAIFDNDKSFLKKPLDGQFLNAKPGTLLFAFKDLPNGTYAVSIFHDLNSNDKLDTNFVGKPIEPYGFSRDARGTFGPPTYDDASFQLDEQVKTIKLSVK